MLDERMQDGYIALWTTDDVVRACDRWLEVWEDFKLHLGPDQTRVRDVDALFHGAEYFINWCQELERLSIQTDSIGASIPRFQVSVEAGQPQAVLQSQVGAVFICPPASPAVRSTAPLTGRPRVLCGR
jgi:hypothetical protein